MKKLFIILIIIIPLITSLFFYINNMIYENYMFYIKDDEVYIFKYIGRNLEEITIPNSIEGKKVTKIDEKAFKNNNSIKRVNIPNSINEIGNKAFYGCENIEYIKIIGTEPKIYENTFDNGIVVKHVYQQNGYTGKVWEKVVLEEYDIPTEVLTIEDIPDCVYNQENISPEISIKYKEKVLTENDFTYTISENKNVGTATIIISGQGDYVGNIEKTFKIVPKDISGLNFSKIDDSSYTGKNITRNIKITDNKYSLVEGTDYKLTYKNNKNVGTATVTVTGIGNYKGSKSFNFKIKSVSIDKVKISGIKAAGYDEKGAKLSLTMTLNNVTLSTNDDFTIEYSNNMNIGTGTVTIKGKKNITGTVTKTFEIGKADISTLTFNKLKSFVYTGSEIKQPVTVTQSGRKLVENEDYTVEFSNNINLGTATVIVTGIGNYKGSKKLTFSIEQEKLYIKINCTANVVTVYKGTEDNLTPIRAMVCSTGSATPTSGKYKIKNKYRWRLLYGNVYGQYATQIVGDILFHSVPYKKQSPDTLKYEEYDKLGTKASMGCIRLTVEDAKWIYDNIKEGTIVEFYNLSTPGPLGKPTAMKISSYTEYRNWDPTDPSDNNPWKNIK